MSAVLELAKHTKNCTKCGENKALSEFAKRSDKMDGLRSDCKICVRARHSEWRKKQSSTPEKRAEYLAKKIADYRNKNPEIKKRGVQVKLTEDGRECLSCGQVKAWDDFAKDINGFNHKTATCKTCRNGKARAWAKANPSYGRGGIKNRPAMLKKKYGITYEQVLRMHDDQHGLCANRGCGKEISLEINGITSNRAVIDHDHATGKVRALLCPPCNMMLGMIETKENALLGLMEYRTKHKDY